MSDLNKDGLVGGSLVSEADFNKVVAIKQKEKKAAAKAKAEAAAKVASKVNK